MKIKFKHKNSIVKQLLLVSIFLFITYPIFAQQVQYKTCCYVSGKMYVGENSTPSKSSIYIGGHALFVSSPDIIQNGKTILLGDFTTNVSSGNIFNSLSTGSFEFKGEKSQHINGSADKINNYINFPNLIINNQTKVTNLTRDTSAVFLAPNLGISTQDLVLERGRLILESDLINDPILQHEKTQTAHLLVQGEASYPLDNSKRTIYDKGLIQVNVNLRDEYGDGGLIGFTPPFKKIYADYFLFNMVSKPTHDNIFGKPPRLFREPMDSLIGGRGYFIGLGAIPLERYDEAMDVRWFAAEPDDRYTNKLLFSRDFAPLSLMQFVNEDRNIKDAWTGEEIITESITVTLEKGRNFLGNPFTVPIDLTKLINATAYDTEWDINPSSHLNNQFYILKDGRASFKELGENIDDPVSYSFIAEYDTIKKGDNKSTLVAPMQMFIVDKKTDGTTTMRIPASARTHGDAYFLRASDESKYPYSILPIHDSQADQSLFVYYQDNVLHIKDLQSEDIGSRIGIYDIGGRLLKLVTVKDIPTQHLPVTLAKGIYLVYVSGKTNIVRKVVVK